MVVGAKAWSSVNFETVLPGVHGSFKRSTSGTLRLNYGAFLYTLQQIKFAMPFI